MEILLLCKCCNFSVSFCCLSGHFWSDFSDRLLMDFQWTNSKSASSLLEMTIKDQWNSSRHTQPKSDRRPTDSVTVIVIMIIIQYKKELQCPRIEHLTSGALPQCQTWSLNQLHHRGIVRYIKFMLYKPTVVPLS